MCAQGGFMHCTGSDSIKVTTQLKTLENSWEHRKTSKIIWYHHENNWGPVIDTLVQFEKDFNSRTEKSRIYDWMWCERSHSPQVDEDKMRRERNLTPVTKMIDWYLQQWQTYIQKYDVCLVVLILIKVLNTWCGFTWFWCWLRPFVPFSRIGLYLAHRYAIFLCSLDVEI